MMHPVGPHTSGVYWVRRVIVVAVAVALVIGLIWWLAGRGTDSAEVDPAALTTTTTSTQLTGVLAAPTVTDDIFGDVDETDVADETDDDGDEGDAGSGPVTITGSDDGDTVASESADDGAPAAAGTATTGPTATTTGATKSTETTAADTTDPTTADKVKTSDKTKAGDEAKSTGTPRDTATSVDKPKKKPKTTTTAPPPPSYDSAGRLICPDASLSVTAITWSTSYPVGSQPRLGMAVTNTGTQPCVRDLSGTLQTYTVYTAAGERVWSTDDCFPGEGHEVRELTPGATANYIIKWAGTTSEPGCAAPRVPVVAGKYVLVAKLGTLKSKKHAFTMR